MRLPHLVVDVLAAAHRVNIATKSTTSWMMKFGVCPEYAVSMGCVRAHRLRKLGIEPQAPWGTWGYSTLTADNERQRLGKRWRRWTTTLQRLRSYALQNSMPVRGHSTPWLEGL